MKFLAFLILVICYGKASAQTFEAEATIPEIADDGFYSIFIPPRINVYLKDDFSNIRIYDQQNREVPYLIQEGFSANSNEFHEYEILLKNHTSGCCTLLMLRDSAETPINNIRLIIQNTAVTGEATLLGSNDRLNWFTLKDWFVLKKSKPQGETFEIKVTDFPKSNYEFYFLRFNDAKEPLRILKAEYSMEYSMNENYTEIHPLKIVTSDSALEKKTYVHLLFDTLQFINKLEIAASGVKYFRRTATLFEKQIKKSKKGKPTEYYNSIKNFELTSEQPTTLELSDVRTQGLLVVIENDDNPSLTVSAVKSFQLNRYLIASLDKDNQYIISFGQPDLKPPVYDLTYFKDSIPKEKKVLEPKEIRIIERSDTFGETFFTSTTLIWAIIIVVILVLGFMSVKLVRESAEKRKKE